jgi:hypothetical protein
MNIHRTFAIGVAAAAALILPACAAGILGGCASEKPAPKAAPVEAPKPQPASLTTIKSEILNTKAQVQTTTEALNNLAGSSTDQAQANYNKFTEEYLKLKAKSEAVSARSADLKARTEAYYSMWNKQSEVDNPELRRQAIQQKADAEKIFSTINTELDLTRSSFQPYMSNLKDVGNYLKNNVTPANLKSVADLVTKTNAQAKEVGDHADHIVAEIDKITAATGETVAPSKAAPAPAN